jgi:hypothetical protein
LTYFFPLLSLSFAALFYLILGKEKAKDENFINNGISLAKIFKSGKSKIKTAPPK